MQRWTWIVAAAWLAGCLPAQSPSTTESSAPQPSAEMAAAFPECTWGEVAGAGAVIGSFTCSGDRLIADETLPGFVRETTAPDGTHRWPVVRLFDIAENASFDSILPAVRQASPAAGIESCAFASVQDHTGWFELRPTGALLETYNRFLSGAAEEPSMPCGQLGPSEAGARYFFILPGAVNKVAVVDQGSDMPIFDIGTLRAAP